MTRTSQVLAALVLGQLVGQLGWIDFLFVPLVLLAPLVTGAVAAARGVPALLVSVTWCSAGLAMLWTDWVVNHEDVLFHLALSVLMPLLAMGGYAATRLARRRQRAGAATGSSTDASAS